MRLLHVDTFQLEEFVGIEATPRYAILSHTWAGDEVLFADICDLPRARAKAGFAKIQRCCEQARTDGLDWAWIDTCCIDKSSSAELSEAINSMYAWYQDAMVCYAYLGDVANTDELRAALRSLQRDRMGLWSKNLAARQSCRWLLRGWTLQELIAPAWLKFYGGESWEYLGSKKDFVQQLEAATGIDAAILDHTGSLGAVSAARKMHWAARRATTRVEDGAYSLLGLFGVNMLLLYGEGERAFIRLQEHILNATEDHTVFMFGQMSPLWPRGSSRPLRSPAVAVRGPQEFDADYDVFSLISYSPANPRFIAAEKDGGSGLRITLPCTQNLRGLLRNSGLSDKNDNLWGVSLVAFNVWANVVADEDAMAYSFERDEFCKIAAGGRRNYRVVMLVDYDDEFDGVAAVRGGFKCHRLNRYVLVPEFEVKTWANTQCYMISGRPRMGVGLDQWIDWQVVSTEQKVGMGYTVKHLERNFLPSNKWWKRLQCVWVLECTSMPDVFAQCECRVTLGDKEMSFVVVTEIWPRGSDAKECVERWQENRSSALRDAPKVLPSRVDGLQYEQRYPVTDGIDVVWCVVRRKGCLYGALTVQPALKSRQTIPEDEVE